MIRINTNRVNDSENIEEPKSENSSDYKNKIDPPSTGDLSGKIVPADSAASEIDVNDCLVTSEEDVDEIEYDIVDTYIEIAINTSRTDWDLYELITEYAWDKKYQHIKIKLANQIMLSVPDISLFKNVFSRNSTLIDVEVETNKNLDLQAIAIASYWATGKRTIKSGAIVKAAFNYTDDFLECFEIINIISSNSNYEQENILNDIKHGRMLNTNDLIRYKIFDGIV